MREENHQLRLTEAQLSDPGRIDHIARQLGLDTPQPGQVVHPDGAFAGGAPVLAEAKIARLRTSLVSMVVRPAEAGRTADPADANYLQGS